MGNSWLKTKKTRKYFDSNAKHVIMPHSKTSFAKTQMATSWTPVRPCSSDVVPKRGKRPIVRNQFAELPGQQNKEAHQRNTSATHKHSAHGRNVKSRKHSELRAIVRAGLHQ